MAYEKQLFLLKDLKDVNLSLNHGNTGNFQIEYAKQSYKNNAVALSSLVVQNFVFRSDLYALTNTLINDGQSRSLAHSFKEISRSIEEVCFSNNCMGDGAFGEFLQELMMNE